MKTIELTDEQYETILQSAKINNKTPEEVIAEMIDHLTVGRADNEIDFFRQLGASEEEIQQIVNGTMVEQ